MKGSPGRDNLVYGLLDEADQQRLAAALQELSNAQQQKLLSTLAQAQIDAQAVKEWLVTGALQEWVKQSLSIQAEKGEAQATVFLAMTATLLPVLMPGEISEWVRLGREIGQADEAGVF